MNGMLVGLHLQNPQWSFAGLHVKLSFIALASGKRNLDIHDQISRFLTDGLNELKRKKKLVMLIFNTPKIIPHKDRLYFKISHCITHLAELPVQELF